jgi:hypothetical protein
MMYCAVFLVEQPLLLALIPLLIYAIFNLAASAGDRVPPSLTSRFNELQRLQVTALLLANNLEVVVFPYLIMNWLIIGGNGVITVLMYFQFLSLRYRACGGTRHFVTMYVAKLDSYLGSFSVYWKVRNFLGQFSG